MPTSVASFNVAPATATKIAFISTAVSGTASNSATLGPITIQQQDAFGDPIPTTAAVSVSLSSTSTGTNEFAATSGGAAITSVTIPANSSTATASFYYGDTKAGTPTITAAAAGLVSGTQSETIAGATAIKLVITSSPFTAATSASATSAFTVTLEDGFGNATTKATAITVNLTSNSTGTHRFAATSGGANVTSVTLPANTSSFTAYYGDLAAGTPTITAAATGLTSGTQQETINTFKLAITSTAFSGAANASATNAFTVTLENAGGNPTTIGSVTTINLSSSSTGAEFAATSGGAAVTSVTLPANTSSVTAYYGDTKTGTPTITATASGLTSATQQETITAGAAAQLIFTTGPVSGGASTSATVGPITVQEQDAYGNVTKTALTVNLASNSAGTNEFAATSGGAAITSLNIAAGSSTATFYYGDTKAGTPTITATATGLTSGTQQETVTAGTGTQLAITSTAFTGAANASATNAFTVTLEDAFGNATTKASATTVNLTSNSAGTHEFASTSGGANVTSVSLPANTALVSAYYGDERPGTPSITAAATGLTSATQQETITAGAPTKLIFTTGAVSGSASSSATLGPITVQEQDAYDNVATSGSPTTVNLSSTSAGASFAATSGGAAITSVTIPGSFSTATFYYGDTQAGTPTITAAATGLTSGTQQETITALAATQLGVSAFTGAAGSTATNAFTVTLEDGFGNATTKASATTVNLTSNSAGTHEFAATSGGANVTSVTLPANTASVTAYYGDQKSGSPTITAAATGLTSGTQQETITGGTATQLAITSSAFSGTTNASATNAFTVTLEDGFGNATTKASATTVNLTSNSAGTHEFAATSGGANVTSVTLPANTSSVTAYYGDEKVGTPTITAAATALTSGTQQETITAGAASKLIFTTGAVSGTAASSPTLGPITVQEQDAFGNVSTTALTVNLSSSSTGTNEFAATSGGTAITSINIAAGSSTATFYYGDTKSGIPILTAAATGVTSGTQSETITAGTGTQLAITSSAFSGGANASATNAFTVTLEDGFGNATTKASATTVNLTSNSAGTHEFAATSGGANVTSVTLPANTASVTAYYGDQKPGTPTITAAATGLTSGTQQETITGGTATQLAITSSAFSGTTNASATNAFTVTLEDSLGNATTKASATTVNLTSNSAGTHEFAATSGGANVTSVTLPANTSSVTAYYGDEKVGTPTITAAATALTSGTQQETITAGAASKLIFTTGAVSGTAASSPTLGPITVQEQDAFGNVSTTALTVNLSSSSTGTNEFAATSGGTAITSINIAAGSSTATFYYGDTKSGIPILTAAATGVTSGTQSETITAGTGTQLAITSSAFSGTTNASATNAFTVTLEDGFGNATTKASATTVNLTSNSAGTHEFAATSGGANVTSVTLPANTASVTAYYGDTKAGTPTITAAATGVTSGTQQETITAGTTTQLAITSSAFSGTTNASATNAFTVTLEDSLGNATTKASATTVNLTSNSAGTHEFAATSGGANVTSVTLPANTSSVTAYYGDEKVGTPTITAAATALTSGTQQETITAGIGTQLAITSSAFSGGAGASATNAFTVTLEDSFSNATTGSTLTVNLSSNSAGTHEFAATSGGANVTSVTLPANTASVTAYYGDQKSGSPTITAAATGLTSGTQQETITAGTGTQLAITSSAFSGTTNASATNAFTVTLEDGFGNATTKASATTVNLTSNSAGTHEFAATSGGANVTSVTLPANTSSVTAYYGDEKVGTPTITAAATAADVGDPARDHHGGRGFQTDLHDRRGVGHRSEQPHVGTDHGARAGCLRQRQHDGAHGQLVVELDGDE